ISGARRRRTRSLRGSLGSTYASPPSTRLPAHVRLGAMAKEFFHRDMQLFIDHRFDWARYLRLRRGEHVNVADEVATYKDGLRTTDEICQAIAEGARGHWHDEVKLVDGEVVVPPHIAAGYEQLRKAGLLCLTMDPAYGGYGLPALVNTAYLEMVARADSSLMT